jgi:hypothetical protein
MPDFLSPELLALRERAEQLATGTLIALRDDPALTAQERRDRVRHASQAAGLYGLTQSEQVSALSLLVARETLASHGVGHLDASAPIRGSSAQSANRCAPATCCPCWRATSAQALRLPNRAMPSGTPGPASKVTSW